MNSYLNTLRQFPYNPRYYIKKPWKFFQQCGRNIKRAWQRVTRGYCDSDVWNMDSWLLAILPPMLRQLRDDEVGAYPGVEPFETPEKWERWLGMMADRIELLQDDWGEEVELNYTNDEERQKCIARMKELSEYQQATTIEVFTELGRHLYQLWS